MTNKYLVSCFPARVCRDSSCPLFRGYNTSRELVPAINERDFTNGEARECVQFRDKGSKEPKRKVTFRNLYANTATLTGDIPSLEKDISFLGCALCDIYEMLRIAAKLSEISSSAALPMTEIP